MTDARLRGEWLTSAAHDALTDAAYRVLHNALMHSAEQGTDGAISERELRFLYPHALDQRVLEELEHAGFWERTASGFQLIGWSTALGQSTAADVAERKAVNAARQARWRAKQATSGARIPAADRERVTEDRQTRDEPSDVTRDEPSDVTHRVGQGRAGPLRASPALKEQRPRANTASRGGGLVTVLPGRECAPGQHRLVEDGSCMLCDIRPGHASTATREREEQS